MEFGIHTVIIYFTVLKILICLRKNNLLLMNLLLHLKLRRKNLSSYMQKQKIEGTLIKLYSFTICYDDYLLSHINTFSTHHINRIF